MKFNGRLEIKPTDILLKKRELQDMGKVQKYIDSECIRRMKPYTPMLSGLLVKSATIGTVIGSGEIHQNTPYARYLYYGKLMVSSITGSSYASKGEKKVLTSKDLTYNKSANPNAGAFWFERMKSDHKDKILKGAQEIANRGG